ncbi:CsbD family protein [Serratia sp. NPDC078593]|uniref:CsbD family protein n=1 Tax=unclassified Serratia (in: enterobacteria) TaxID=2647522 RepID=UPI0037CDCC70
MFDKANDKIDEAIGAGQEQLGKTFDQPEHEFKGKVRKQLARGAYTVDDMIESVKDHTKSSPLAALLIAAGAGFVLGKIITRK